MAATDGQASEEAKPRIEGLLLPFQEFVHREESRGLLLLTCTVVALLWANSPWAETYVGLWQTKLGIAFGEVGLAKPLLLWINDGLMAMFFFVIGLEIKREVLVGELSSPRQAILPIAVAVGGMVVPAMFYLLLHGNRPGAWLGHPHGHGYRLRLGRPGAGRPQCPFQSQDVPDCPSVTPK